MPYEGGGDAPAGKGAGSRKGVLYQFKITLKDVRPPVWRRFLVPDWITLGEFGEVVEDVMGWYGLHLHEFIVKGVRYGSPDTGDPDFDSEVVDEGSVTLRKLRLSVKERIRYDYDFGDDWRHDLLLEKILPADGRILPVCLKGARACPPEDSGGPWGYQELLEVLKDPKNEGYASMKEWIGEEFDPEDFDLESLNEILSSRGWTA
ncbi:MAG: plasmid pRiA4b ORF-3 family protein [Leptospirales bacterium]